MKKMFDVRRIKKELKKMSDDEKIELMRKANETLEVMGTYFDVSDVNVLKVINNVNRIIELINESLVKEDLN